jgi:hypothetical protein
MIVGHQSAILYHQKEIDGTHGVVDKCQSVQNTGARVCKTISAAAITGSNPVRKLNIKYGVVAKWQGKGLQNPHHGFKSRRRL